MEQLNRQILECLQQGEPFALAAIIGHSGSTPRTSGSRMIVLRDRTIFGTIGGGLVEARVIDQCIELIEAGCCRISDFSLDKKLKDGLDMVCGGNLTVLMETLAPDPDLVRLFEAVAALERNGKKGVLISGIRGSGRGDFTTHKCLVTPDGTTIGAAVIPKPLMAAVQDNRFNNALPSLYSHGPDRFIIQPVLPADTLFIFGAGHVGFSLAQMAHLTDFRTVVVDDREEFANRNRFPHAGEVVVTPDFSTCFSSLDVGTSAYIVILTRGHLHDQTVLEQALATDAAYIGMIGSRPKRNQIYENLKEKGVTQDQLDAVRSPIGLDIRAETPAEIAVSILAEIIQIRAGRTQTAGNKTTRTKPIQIGTMK